MSYLFHLILGFCLFIQINQILFSFCVIPLWNAEVLCLLLKFMRESLGKECRHVGGVFPKDEKI